MACTTLLVGKKASNDGSTMIARNDDSPGGRFSAKKLAIMEPQDQPRHYKSVLSHVEIDLPDNPLRYTYIPNVDKSKGYWGAAGVNSENVGMTATETITTNERVMAADPLVELIEKNGDKKEVPGGIGEEDLVMIVLPYIHSAREGVIRLGQLLEKYGTYENNGIAFNDGNEIWWLETIGGHHYIARRVPDDRYVVMPNQFGLDNFDFEDAYGEKKEHMCSPDLKEFVEKNHLDLGLDGKFNPRLAFGSHADSDHIYNTPRAWFIGRHFNPRSFKWDGEDADFTPSSDDIPWSFVPERKITLEEVKYALSSYYQGTPYNPYAHNGDASMRGAFRPIGISRTDDLAVLTIRSDLPKEVASVEWFSFGCNAFNALVPFFPQGGKVPEYYSNTTLDVDSNSFYWANRLIASMSDAHFNMTAIHIERYQDALQGAGRLAVKKAELAASKGELNLDAANEAMAATAKKLTTDTLGKVLYATSCLMKNGFARSDN